MASIKMNNFACFLALTGATLVAAENVINLAPFCAFLSIRLMYHTHINRRSRRRLHAHRASPGACLLDRRRYAAFPPRPEHVTDTQTGRFVYELNLCTIVESTTCQVSMSTGGLVPEEPSSTADSASPTPTGEDEPTAIDNGGKLTSSSSTEEDQPTATESVADEEPTGNAAKAKVFGYGAFGLAGLAAAYLV